MHQLPGASLCYLLHTTQLHNIHNCCNAIHFAHIANCKNAVLVRESLQLRIAISAITKISGTSYIHVSLQLIALIVDISIYRFTIVKSMHETDSQLREALRSDCVYANECDKCMCNYIMDEMK